jgi:hypothetical protein
MGKKFLPVLLFFLLISVFPLNAQTIDADVGEIRSNLEYLASDELMGRGTLTEGERLASEFIAEKFRQYGIKPFGDNGTYFQSFPLALTSFTEESKVKVYSGGNETTFRVVDDFIIDVRRVSSDEFQKVKKDIVFAGFGITAPEFNYDDYRGLDVKGKTVLILDDEPLSNDTNFFRGQRPTRYSFWGTKGRIARDNGAAGIIIIAPDGTVKEWQRLAEWTLGGGLRYPETESASNPIIPVVCVLPEVAKMILDGEEKSYEEIDRMFKESEEVTGFNVDKQFEFDLVVKEEIQYSRNVVGIIEGTDDILKTEYVSIGAHYDHEGIRNGEVYNGADDNASGTVAVMEAGKLLAETKSNKRSIILMLYSAEERGLYGSRYTAENAPYIKDMIANINLDMVGRMSEDTIFSIGSGRLSSELRTIVESSNSKTSNFVLDYTFDTPDDPNRLYERSDHYNFAKQGIPVVFFTDNMSEDYHKPSDDPFKINYLKIEKICELVYDITLELSNLDRKLIIDGTN